MISHEFYIIICIQNVDNSANFLPYSQIETRLTYLDPRCCSNICVKHVIRSEVSMHQFSSAKILIALNDFPGPFNSLCLRQFPFCFLIFENCP